MNSIARGAATFFIWVAFAMIATEIADGSGDTGKLAVLGLVTLLSTFAVWWRASVPAQQSQPKQVRVPLKQKRNQPDRITRLVDVLDDDEAYALLSELQARLGVEEEDEEPLSLERLLAEREAEQDRYRQ
jgi:hypothetical protein